MSFLLECTFKVIVITETKLSAEHERYFFRCLKEKYWLNFNHFNKSNVEQIFGDSATNTDCSAGIMVLIAKDLSEPPISNVRVPGMLSETLLTLKGREFSQLRLLSYYCPHSLYRKKLYSLLKEYESDVPTILAGDFNDYMSSSDIISNSKSKHKSRGLSDTIHRLDFHSLQDNSNFSLNKEMYKSRPDWIFVSQDLFPATSPIVVEDFSYKTDHNPISVQISLPRKHTNRPFVFQPQLLKDKTLKGKLEKEIDEIVTTNKDDPFIALQTVTEHLEERFKALQRTATF